MVDPNVFKAVGDLLLDQLLDGPMERLLVALQCQDIITAAIDDLLGNGLLTPGRVNRHHGALEIELIEKLRNGRDFGVYSINTGNSLRKL